MSDDEYEYEYDDDASMEDDQGGEEDQFEYTDEEEEADGIEVELENAYYNAKGLRDTSAEEAKEAFLEVISKDVANNEAEGKKKYGIWSFKAMKQLLKADLRLGDGEGVLKDYQRLLTCIGEGDVSPNQIEKGINGMLERVSSLYQGSYLYGSSSSTENTKMDPQALALQVYDATLQTFHPNSGACQNERLWFKTTIKYGQLLYEMNDTPKLQKVLQDLKAFGSTPSNESASSTQSMEIYALQIQLYSRQRDHKNLRQTFDKAMAVRGGIPHPRTLALIQELGGKMHMESKQYEEAGKTFFQAFKSYDEAGDPARLKCLQYLVLASMLHASSINPFDSQEARPYKDDPEILAMTNLVQAFQDSDIHQFEKILQSQQGQRMLKHDEFIREHLTDLLHTIRTQVIQKVLVPYRRITLEALATHHLNKTDVSEVEALLVQLILKGSIQAKIDKTEGVLIMDTSVKNTAQESTVDTAMDLALKQTQAMQSLMDQIEQVSLQVTATKVKEGPAMMGTLSSGSGATSASMSTGGEGGFRPAVVH